MIQHYTFGIEGKMPALSYPSYPLTDGDIWLRGFQEKDAQVLLEICQDQEIVQWTRVPEEYSLQQAKERIWKAEENRLAGKELSLAIVDGEDQLLGSCDLRFLHGDRGIGEVGYLLGREARGQGVMSRAVRLLAIWALTELDLHRVEILLDPANQASLRVAQRAGFVLEGRLRQLRGDGHQRRDRNLYSLLLKDISSLPRIEGLGVRLMPVCDSHLALLHDWFSQLDFVEHWGGELLSKDQVRLKYLNQRSNVSSFLIVSQHQAVGYIHYWDLAEKKVGMDMVLKKKARGQGVGPQAAKLLVTHLQQKGFSSIEAEPGEDNISARRAWAKAGFLPDRSGKMTIQ
jgi:aminoglycoside 6'-N-acetyltransferase